MTYYPAPSGTADLVELRRYVDQELRRLAVLVNEIEDYVRLMQATYRVIEVPVGSVTITGYAPTVT